MSQIKKGLPADLKVGDTILVWGREACIISIENTKKLYVLELEDSHTRELTTLVRYPDEVIVAKK